MSANKKIAVFLDGDGKITRIPVPNRTKIRSLAYLADKFEENRDYTEREVNSIIAAWHTFNDYFILRRLLVDYGFLNRVPDGSRYWKPDKGTVKPQFYDNERIPCVRVSVPFVYLLIGATISIPFPSGSLKERL